MNRVAFVIGAGASTEFGNFPVGAELAERIEIQLTTEIQNRDGPIINCFAANGGFNSLHEQAMRRILRGLQSRESIDEFINDCAGEPMVSDIAKVAIALKILESENTSIISNVRNEEHPATIRELRNSWLGQVCRLTARIQSPQNFPKQFDRVSFITFNYDRCIESYLVDYAAETLAKTRTEGGKLVSNVQILHAFGQLGSIPEFDLSRDKTVRFGDFSNRNPFRSSNGIKTFNEEIGSEHASRIQTEISAADTIVFLGFQYHNQNMKILQSHGPIGGKKIFGTTYQMTLRRKASLENQFKENGNTVVFDADKCSNFMNKHGEDIFDL